MPRTAVLATIALAVAFPIGDLYAQSEPGYAAREMTRIKTQSIGRGYTADSVVSTTTQQLKPRIGAPGSSTRTGFGLPSPTSVTPATPTTRRAATFDSFGPSLSANQKPFSNAQTEPTVSPYLNLFNDTFLGDGVDNYNTIVRPQLRQQQFNQQVRREAQSLNRRVQQLSARPAFDPRGSQQQSPTGHSTGFMYYSHFYPSAGPVDSRQR